ncbi:hypothetical protein GOODEAATRI_019385 [Goodea atripinnis]|uniref:Secreted protein n=1 Tax=Goodea atripinnis TaxID=208336 RepID=A0ABV0N5Y3_9TELE
MDGWMHTYKSHVLLFASTCTYSMFIPHKPHSYEWAHSCSAFPSTSGRNPDAAYQCTSLSEPQAAEEKRNRWAPAVWMCALRVHSYCIAPHTYTHTHMHRH